MTGKISMIYLCCSNYLDVKHYWKHTWLILFPSVFSSHPVFSSSSHIKDKKIHAPFLQGYFMVPKDIYKCSKDIYYVCTRKDTHLSEFFPCPQAKWSGEICVHVVQSSLSSRLGCDSSIRYSTCLMYVTRMPYYR